MKLTPDDEFNQKLLQNVRPSSWVNPTPKEKYNLVVIGAGSAGLVSAAGAAGLGAKVALIEKHLLGGDCLNYGCVPSKGIIRAARAAHEVRNAKEFGVHVNGSVEVHFSEAMARMRRLRAEISPNDSVQRLQSLGVDVFLGEGKFTSSNQIEVDERTLRFSKAVIATGARAVHLPIPGLKEAGALTNETVFSLTELPKRLLVIGAGPIGVEMAQTFARFGSTVTLFEAMHGLLPREDREAAEIVRQALVKDGIDFKCCVEIDHIETKANEKTVFFKSKHGEAGSVSFDTILVGVGRAPNVEGLGFESAGVKFDKLGVKVNDLLQTSNPRIYAAGDICSVYKFTHAADAMARIVLQNALFFGRKKASALTIPWCTYTDPEIAHVGLYEEQAKKAGYDVVTHTVNLKENDRAILDGEKTGFARIHAERKSGKILGATLVAKHSGEMIGELSLAMTAGLSLKDLAQTIHPYPTQSEVWKRVADQWNRSRFTPGLRRFFQRYFRWFR